MAVFYRLAYRTALLPFVRRLRGFREEGRAWANAPDSGVPVRQRDLLFPADVFFGGRPTDQILLVVQLHGLQVNLPQKPRELLLVAVLPTMPKKQCRSLKCVTFVDYVYRDTKIVGLF